MSDHKDAVQINSRLAVLENQAIDGAADVKEILSEIKNISAFIYECKPRLDELERACAGTRLTRIETRNKTIAWLIGILFTITATKEIAAKWLDKFFN